MSYLFFSPAGKTLGASGSLRLFFACASASSNHACSIGFNAIILLWDNVKLSNLHIVLCDNAPTPGNFKFAKALPTSACVTPSFGWKWKNWEKREEKSKKTQQKFFANNEMVSFRIWDGKLFYLTIQKKGSKKFDRGFFY